MRPQHRKEKSIGITKCYNSTTTPTFKENFEIIELDFVSLFLQTYV